MSTTEMDRQLETQALTAPEQALALQIRTPDDFIAVGELLKGWKALQAGIINFFEPLRQKTHAAWKEVIRKQDEALEPLVRAENIAKPKIAAWLNEQERLRREEELRLQQRAEEEARQRQLEEAAILDEIGETESANALLEETPYVAPIVVQRSTPKVSGIAMQTRWSAQVYDLMQLVKAVAAGKAPIQCLKADEVFLNRQATAMKAALQYPGVKAVPQSNISAGRR